MVILTQLKFTIELADLSLYQKPKWIWNPFSCPNVPNQWKDCSSRFFNMSVKYLRAMLANVLVFFLLVFFFFTQWKSAWLLDLASISFSSAFCFLYIIKMISRMRFYRYLSPDCTMCECHLAFKHLKKLCCFKFYLAQFKFLCEAEILSKTSKDCTKLCFFLQHTKVQLFITDLH